MCDFILVMREFQVETASVDVDEMFLENTIDHADTFRVPAWSSSADFGVEFDTVIISELPKGEV